MNDYDFGNFLYHLRVEKGISQSELGDMMGVSNKAVSKWEMGISKPRPAMLVVLASFFGVTVDELLAGKRNLEAEYREHKTTDYTSLKAWTSEHNKKKRNGRNAVITAIILPILLFIFVGVTVYLNISNMVWEPIVAVAILFAEAIDISLIFVFYGAARRIKRILYATYSEQTDEITAIISPKKERIPMLKWEKASCIIGACTGVLCYVLRIIDYFVNDKMWYIAIAVVAIVLILLASILVLIAIVHYCLRCRHK